MKSPVFCDRQEYKVWEAEVVSSSGRYSWWPFEPERYPLLVVYDAVTGVFEPVYINE